MHNGCFAITCLLNYLWGPSYNIVGEGQNNFTQSNIVFWYNGLIRSCKCQKRWQEQHVKKNVTDSSMIGARNWNTSCKQSCIAAIGQAATRKHVDSKRTSYRSVAWLQGTGGAVEAWGGVFSWSVTHSEQAHCWLGAFLRHNHLTQVCTH